MEAVNIFLFCVVGLSVVVFFIVEYSSNESRKYCCLEADDIHSKNDSECSRNRSVLESEICDEADEGDDKKSENVMNGSLDSSSSFEDWEGIERTELERSFGEAVVYVNSSKSSIIIDDDDGDVRLQLYALQMLALQGSCHGSKPMPFNISARTKWNAWQKLGNMSREMAMEKYLNIVANAIPEWKKKVER